MEKSYTQKVHYRMVIEGDWSCGDMWEEDLFKCAQETFSSVMEHVCENIADLFYQKGVHLELSDLQTIEEN